MLNMPSVPQSQKQYPIVGRCDDSSAVFYTEKGTVLLTRDASEAFGFFCLQEAKSTVKFLNRMFPTVRFFVAHDVSNVEELKRAAL